MATDARGAFPPLDNFPCEYSIAPLRERDVRKVLITKAGSGAATNVMRSLRSAGTACYVVGCNDDPFVLKKSLGDANYLVFPTPHPRFPDSFVRVVNREAIDVVLPVTDADVAAVSKLRHRLRARVFLPPPGVIEMCGDKLLLAECLRARNVPVPTSFGVGTLDRLGEVFRRFSKGALVWCRARHGAGSFGAAPVATAAQARAWIGLWCALRGAKPSEFMVAEFLPGRDFACQSLWKNGRLVLIKTTERLAYVDGAARLSGTSSVASLHKTISDERLVRVATRAVRAVDRRATGAFSIDMREAADGQPRVTEINAGRLISGTTIFDQVGRYNMTAVYIQLAGAESVSITDSYDSPGGYYAVRELDAEPHVFGTADLWNGWSDARFDDDVETGRGKEKWDGSSSTRKEKRVR